MENMFAWNFISWREIEIRTTFIQSKIFIASILFNFRKTRSMQRLIFSSFCSCLIAIKIVCEEDSYRFIFGLDSERWVLPSTKLRAAISLNSSFIAPGILRKVLVKRGGLMKLFFIPPFKMRARIILWKLAFLSFSEAFGRDFQKYYLFFRLQVLNKNFFKFSFFYKKFLIRWSRGKTFNFLFSCRLKKFFLGLISRRFVFFENSFLIFKKSFFEDSLLSFFLKEFFLSRGSFFKTFFGVSNFCFGSSLVGAHVSEIKFFFKVFCEQRQVFLLIYFLKSFIKSWLARNFFLCSAKSVLFFLDFFLYKMLWNWLRKKHFSKSSRWIFNSYWKFLNGRWAFSYLNAQGEVFSFSSFYFLNKDSFFSCFFELQNAKFLKKKVFKVHRYKNP